MSNFDGDGASEGQGVWPTFTAKNEMLQQLDIMFRETWLCTQRHLIRVNILSQQPMQCYPKGIDSKYCAQKLPTVLRILA